jgi:type II secretory pathway component PulC
MKKPRAVQLTVFCVVLGVLGGSFFAFLKTTQEKLSPPVIQIEIPQEWASRAAADITPLLAAARAVPFLDEKTGKMIGIKVMHMEPKSPLDTLAIQDGDIVLQVEEVVFNQPAAGLQAIQAVRGKNKVTVIIERAGKRQHLIYEVK